MRAGLFSDDSGSAATTGSGGNMGLIRTLGLSMSFAVGLLGIILISAPIALAAASGGNM